MRFLGAGWSTWTNVRWTSGFCSPLSLPIVWWWLQYHYLDYLDDDDDDDDDGCHDDQDEDEHDDQDDDLVLFVCRCCCCGDSFYGPWEISGATECDHVEPRDSQASQPEIQGMLGTICWYVIMAANLVRNCNIMQKNPGKNNMTYKSTNWFKKDLQETMVNTCSYHKFNKGFLWNVPSSSIIQFSEQVEEWCTRWVNELIILSPTTFIMAEMRPSMLTLHTRHMFFVRFSGWANINHRIPLWSLLHHRNM